MTYMGSPAKIEIEGLLPVLNSTDGDGVEWIFDTIKGWTGGAGVEVDRVQRSFGHGEFAQNSRRTGRPITVGGWVYSDDDTLIARATDTLAAALADGSFGRLTVTDDRLGARWADVQLIGAIDDDWSKPNLYEFQLQLLAPDPYKYGDTSQDSTGFASTPAGAGLVFDLFKPSGVLSWGVAVDPGTLTVQNGGTADAAVVFTVAGPTPSEGFVIVDLDTAKRITYLGGAVPAGSSIVFDGRDATVLIDGTADRSGDTVVEAWPVVPKNGGTRSFLFDTLGSVTAAVLTGACTATYW